MRSRVAVTKLLCLWLIIGCGPSSDGDELVRDQAGMLDSVQQDRIALFHQLLRADFDIDYRVVTTADADDIDAYSAGLFQRLGAGQLSTTGLGLLLVIDPLQDRVRLEVGYGLEGAYPDAFIAYVEQRQMIPFFRAGRVADGILATTELIVQRAQRAAKNAGLAGEVWLAGSGGAGASTTAHIDQAPDPQQVAKTISVLANGASPAAVLAEYVARMQNRDANPDLELYTPATRRMLGEWVMTPAQMDNIVKTYQRCNAEAERTDASGRLSVIRYPVRQRQCAPWFFEKINGRWALDLTMMQKAIRFGRDNSWHFEIGVGHHYEYAFTDWTFDVYGFPQ